MYILNLANNLMEEKSQKNDNKEETIDLKALVLKYTQYWSYFLLSAFITIIFGFIYNHLTIPEYSVSTTLEIRDDNNTQLGAENLIEGLELFSGKNNLTNEIIILKSYSITEKIINELNLGISYFQHGFLQTKEIFEKSPFIVYVDSTHNQLTGTKFEIEIIDNKSFNLNISSEGDFPYNIKNKKLDKTLITDIDISDTFNFNKKIITDYFAIKISKSKSFDLEQLLTNKNTYSFILHQESKLARSLISKIIINPINKETSILKLNIKDKNPKKKYKYS